VTREDRAHLRALCKQQGLTAEETRKVLRDVAREEHWALQGLAAPSASAEASKSANKAAWRKRTAETQPTPALLWLAQHRHRATGEEREES
jgi:hypothetical protein